MTEFDSPTVSEYLVEAGLVGINKSKLNKSAIINKSSLIDRWVGKGGIPRLVSDIEVTCNNK